MRRCGSGDGRDRENGNSHRWRENAEKFSEVRKALIYKDVDCG